MCCIMTHAIKILHNLAPPSLVFLPFTIPPPDSIVIFKSRVTISSTIYIYSVLHTHLNLVHNFVVIKFFARHYQVSLPFEEA